MSKWRENTTKKTVRYRPKVFRKFGKYLQKCTYIQNHYQFFFVKKTSEILITNYPGCPRGSKEIWVIWASSSPSAASSSWNWLPLDVRQPTRKICCCWRSWARQERAFQFGPNNAARGVRESETKGGAYHHASTWNPFVARPTSPLRNFPFLLGFTSTYSFVRT
jgi:hypothetical protein